MDCVRGPVDCGGRAQFNFGSFGAVPASVWAVYRDYEERMEAVPDPWMRTGMCGVLPALRQPHPRCLSPLVPTHRPSPARRSRGAAWPGGGGQSTAR